MNYWNELKYFFKKIGILRIIPSKYYLSYLYKKITGEKLNLKNPISFNEKLQWLKLYDKNPSYTNLVDKYAVREYVKEKIGDKYLIPLLGGPWHSVDEIDFEALPDQFVLKCTHDSGSVIICEDKSKFDIDAAKKKLNRCLKIKFFYLAREWPYKNVLPAIIAEKYMTDETGYELKDYKVFTFNGVPKLIQVDYDRFQNHKRNLYNTEWEYLPTQIQYPTDSSIKIERPKRLEEMLK
nr:glycosyl transferase [Lachnospiraceae bacterium]